jgi:predicted metalloenzyme YecM
MILENISQSIDKIYTKLTELGVDTSKLTIDHIGYQASSAEDYNKCVDQIKRDAVPNSEHIVGGRRVGVFILNSSINYNNQTFSIIEIFEPRAGQQVESAWEHIEFLTDKTLEEFMGEYANISWDTTALNRDEFPMLILNLGEGLRAKFPRRGVLEEDKRLSH